MAANPHAGHVAQPERAGLPGRHWAGGAGGGAGERRLGRHLGDAAEALLGGLQPPAYLTMCFCGDCIARLPPAMDMSQPACPPFDVPPALQSIPDGLLVFMPSYSLLDRLMQRWKVGG